MKQNLFIMGLAIAALSSCSQNDVLDIPESRTIQFGDSYVGKPTRAASIIENDNFKSFYVFGKTSTDGSDWNTDIFNNVNVYKGDGTAWGYDDLVEYASSATQYSFAAYSNGGIVGKGDGMINGVTFSAGQDADATKLEINTYSTADNKDLVVSFSRTNLNYQSAATDNKPVQFIFKHALAQVKVIIQSALGDENRIVITDFNVEGFKDEAKLTFTKKTDDYADEIAWTDPGSNKTINSLDNPIATTSNSAFGTYTVIPQKAVGDGSSQPDQLNVSLTATLYKNDGSEGVEKAMTATLKNLPYFEAGKCYVLRATIDGPDMGVISFDTPEVTDWQPADEIPMDPNA